MLALATVPAFVFIKQLVFVLRINTFDGLKAAYMISGKMGIICLLPINNAVS